MSKLSKEFTNLSNGILNLTTEYTKKNLEDKKNVWSILLNYLYNENDKIEHYGIRQNDIINNTVWKEIDPHSDFSNNFFSSIYNEVINDLKNFWNNNLTNKDKYIERSEPLWNESIEKTLQYFYKYIDPDGVADFENSGYLIENEDGNIDLDYLKGSIPVNAGVDMRVIDVKNADAANSFVKEEQIYEIKDVVIDGLDIILNRIVINPWVVPWYNVNGHSYRYVREKDRINGVLSNSNKLQFTRVQNEDTAISKNKYIRLIMPTHKRRVEIEDLDRNFWVIAQTITAISAYLFDEQAPIPKMFRNLLNEIMQLWENALYLWLSIAALGAKPYYTDVHTEVVYLTNNEFQSYLKYDNFGNTYTINENEIKNKLHYLIQTYIDSNLCVIPIIRNNNYMKNYYSEEIYPFVLTFNRNSDTDYNIEYYDREIKINLNTDNIGSKLYAIKEDETIYNYFSPYSNIDNVESGIYTNYIQKYYALLRTRVSFDNSLPKLINDKIDWSDLKIELQDVVKNVIDKIDIWYEYYPINKINTIQSNLIDVNFKNIDVGYYMGELISYYKNTNLIDWDLNFETIDLVPYINGEVYFGETVEETNLSWINRKLKNIQEDSLQVLEKYIEKYPPNDKYQIKLYLGDHMYNTSIDNNASDKTYYYLDENNNLVETTKKIKTTQTIQSGVVLYMPSELIYYKEYYAYTDYWATPNGVTWPAGEQGSYGLFNSRVDIYYKGDKLTNDNWVIRYTQIGALAVDGEINNETLIKLNEPYYENKYAVVKTLAVSYFLPKGIFYGKFVIRNISDISKLNSYVNVYSYNWENRPNLFKYEQYGNSQFNGVIFTGDNNKGDYELHWQDGKSGAGL